MNTKLIAVLFVLSAFLSVAAQAAEYTFTPNPVDLSDLDHAQVYLWKFAWSVPVGEQITGATLTFKDITNWANESNNRLQIHLINDPSTSGWTSTGTRTEYGTTQRTYRRSDNDNSGDYFTSWTNQVLVGIYSDRDGVYHQYSRSSDPDITFDFSNLANVCYDSHGNPINIDPDPTANLLATLNTWSADGSWALGFDPDCHYYNNGVTLKITTGPKNVPPADVPEPFTMILGSLGLGAVTAFKKLRAR